MKECRAIISRPTLPTMYYVSLRSAFCLLALVTAFHGSTALGQGKGDSMAAVERVLGQPAIAMNKGGNVVWSYASGRKVTFSKGVVIEITEPPVVAEKIVVTEDPEEEIDEPMPARSLASMPAQKPADAALLSKRAADLAPHHVGVIEWTLRVLAIGVCVVTWTLRRPFLAVAR